MDSIACFFALLSVLYTFWAPCVWGQELRERDAVCSEDGCFVIYFHRKTFLEAWRSCKVQGGNLATLKHQKEARQVEELLSGAERRGFQAKIRVWIGLQRQPRQCSATRPLRGFSWTTGDQDTQYTNWLQEDAPGTCSAPRCVVMTHSTASSDQQDNYKWLDGSCTLPVDGFLCRFVYDKGMCQAIPSEGGPQPVIYSTPFHLDSTLLTHVPFGSVATVSCPEGTKGDQSVLCASKEDGRAAWHRDGPLCTDATPKTYCQEVNGGCDHLCREASDHYYCECYSGFLLLEDRRTCVAVDPCQDNPCQFKCFPSIDRYSCLCPEGYKLGPDGHSCLDKDECQENPCEQACENTPGSFTCHCHLGYSSIPENPTRCQDIDECQIPGSCEHMCDNYHGGFVCVCREGYELQQDYSSCRPIPSSEESTTTTPSFQWLTSPPESSWFPQVPDSAGWPPQMPDNSWLTEAPPLDWLTDPPSLEVLPTDLTWFTDMLPKEHIDQIKQEEQLKQAEQVKLEGQDNKGELEEQEEQGNWEELGEQEKQDHQEEIGEQEEQGNEEEMGEQEKQDNWEELEEQEEQGNQEEMGEQEEQDNQEEQREQREQAKQKEQEGQKQGEHEEPRLFEKVTQSWIPEDLMEPSQPALPSSSATTTEWLEEENTFSPTAPLTTTPGGGAWNFWHSVTQTAPKESIRQGEIVVQPWDGSHSGFGTRDDVPTVAEEEGIIPEDETSPAPPTPEPGNNQLPESDSSQQQNSSWLLIALLVPLCIFVVVMVALGIVYCTRCAAKRTRSKNTKDCYHWISGANDKMGAPGTAKSHV